MVNTKWLIILVMLVILYFLFSRVEYYETCGVCGGRIVTAAVFADPNNTAGLGWIV